MDKAQKLALLRRYEPIIRFTHGEEFFPMDAEAYIRACSLWVKRPKEEPLELVAATVLTPETLAAPYEDEYGAVRFLKFTEPLSATEMAAQALRQRREGDGREDDFRVGTGRLARVGYASRIVDALFRVALLARGRVPGDAAAAASQGYRLLKLRGLRCTYHGRVVEESGWVVLQYWYFYLYNNWRSRFNGANDHEADWEMVSLYLAPDSERTVQPEWVAFASHDYQGDDLRRRWDDPEVLKVDGHPVIFAGAGSHAAYFSPGEYLTEIELNAVAPLTRAANTVRRIWKRLMRETEATQEEVARAASGADVLAIPFVDYARGDGLSIGPSQTETWDTPRLIDEQVGWVRAYRGLWGLFTQDPFAGEDAPAGPMYNRNGAVRRAWYDPVGWAGLDKVAPGAELLTVTRQRRQEIADRRAQLRLQVADKTARLRTLDVQAAAMRSQPHLRQGYLQTAAEIEKMAQEIDAMHAEIAENDAVVDSLDRYASYLEQGGAGSLRAHIRRAHAPAAAQVVAGQIAEIWAAVSVTVLLVAFVFLFYFNPRFLPIWLASILAFFALIEASVRGTFTRLVGSLASALAIAGALVLLYEFFWWVAGAVILTLALYILWDNLRELLRTRRARL